MKKEEKYRVELCNRVWSPSNISSNICDEIAEECRKEFVNFYVGCICVKFHPTFYDLLKLDEIFIPDSSNIFITCWIKMLDAFAPTHPAFSVSKRMSKFKLLRNNRFAYPTHRIKFNNIREQRGEGYKILWFWANLIFYCFPAQLRSHPTSTVCMCWNPPITTYMETSQHR